MLLKIYRSRLKAAIISQMPENACDANHSLLRRLALVDSTQPSAVNTQQKLEKPLEWRRKRLEKIG
jgi:hypothetical protein